MATRSVSRIPTPRARQRAFRSALRDVAVAVTLLEQANEQLERDKTPIDATAESNLERVAGRLYGLFEDGRYVGVDYGDESKSKGVANLLGKVSRADTARRELRARGSAKERRGGRAGGAA